VLAAPYHFSLASCLLKGAAVVPDQEFSNPKLAVLYDHLDSGRTDLNLYVDLIEKLNVESVLDIGCGTGSLLCRLAKRGYKLWGLDPATASLDIARGKCGSESVNWVLGCAESLPKLEVDIALMTGNVAQVFLTDEDWLSALSSIHGATAPSGYFVFETRDPERRAWEEWNRASTLTRVDVPGIGFVVSWVELIEVEFPLISFKWTYQFERDGSVLTSESTLRFRSKQELEDSLVLLEFNVIEVRDAPDRPNKEFVFIAKAGIT